MIKNRVENQMTNTFDLVTVLKLVSGKVLAAGRSKSRSAGALQLTKFVTEQIKAQSLVCPFSVGWALPTLRSVCSQKPSACWWAGWRTLIV